MRVYTHYTEIVNTNNGYRWRTILQFGTSWSIIGSIVMKNPGGANFKYKDHHAEIDEGVLSHLRKFDSEHSKNEEWYEFNSDNTLNLVHKLFSERSNANKLGELNGVIQVFNLFYLKNPNLSEGLAFNNMLNLSEINDRIFEDDIQSLTAPIYLGYGNLAQNPQFKVKAKRFFDKATHELGANYLNPNFDDNKFYHPQWLMGRGKNHPNSQYILNAFCQNTQTPIYNHLIIQNIKISKEIVFQKVLERLHRFLTVIEDKPNTCRFYLSDELGVTVTRSGSGYIGVRHSNYKNNKKYSNTSYPHTSNYRQILKQHGFDISIDVWLGEKDFKDYGNNDNEIIERICKEIKELKEEIQKV